MVKKIRLCKGREIGGKSFAIGVTNKDWDIPWIVVNFPDTRLFTEIKDGSIDGYPVFDKVTGQAVPATEIVKWIFRQNNMTVSQDRNGIKKRHHYGELRQWFIDYDSALEKFFEENNIPIPADKRSYDERMTETALGNLQAQGVNISAGQQALEDAKARNAELAKAKEELVALKAEKEQLEKSLMVTIPKAEKKEKVAA